MRRFITNKKYIGGIKMLSREELMKRIEGFTDGELDCMVRSIETQREISEEMVSKDSGEDLARAAFISLCSAIMLLKVLSFSR